MPYSKQVFAKVKAELEQKREHALSTAEAHRAELHRDCPEVAEIDRSLSNTGLGLFQLASKGGDDLQLDIDRFRDRNIALQKMRADLLRSKGYPADYTIPHYECETCSDTGYIGIDMCSCFRKALARESFLTCGLGMLSGGQTFESFDVGVYSTAVVTGKNMGKSPRAIMEGTLAYCRRFADNFGTRQENIIMIGAPGVGKTHLTSAMAHKIIERGFDVVYDTAQSILYAFEKERYNRGTEERSTRYFECDLLILDDLGTEYTGPMTNLSLFNVINTRTLAGQSTIISTNLGHAELQKRYDNRILSRLFGEFTILTCCDEDIRRKKVNML